MRLHQISFAMRQQMETGGATGADTLAGLAGFAPPTMHAMGLASPAPSTGASYNVAVTNVPGPQRPFVCRGRGDGLELPGDAAQPRQGLSIGLTSPMTAASTTGCMPTGMPSPTSTCSATASWMDSKGSSTRPVPVDGGP